MRVRSLKTRDRCPGYLVQLCPVAFLHHGLVRDERGEKYSKTRGNVVDPLDLINRYGADALRFTLAALTMPGSDLKLSESRTEGYRHFVNKIWNASRFALMNLE